MAGGPSVAVLRDIQTLFDTGTVCGLSDRQLLERFESGRDASAEAAFGVLVERHGPMVLRVCQNVLGDATDAQDAFQATFLVLVKRAGSIRRLESLGSWLYGVACRVAARARVEAARRRAIERRGALRVVHTSDSPERREADHAEFGPVVQEEVRRLPEKYRAVVALCYWQGLTQEQAATQLGCPLGTVRSRLARARDKLHTRLTRRGLAPLAAGVAAALESRTAEASRLGLGPEALLNSTVKASAQIKAGGAMGDLVSTSVAVLTQRVLRSMFMMKFKTVAVAVVLFGLGAYGAILAAPQKNSGKSPSPSQRGSKLGVAKSKSKAQPPLVTLENYVIDPPDLLVVEVLDALPGRPITGERLVRPDGKISLGFYGDIYVAGLTIAEVQEKVVRHLQKYLSDEALGLVTVDENDKPELDPETGKPKMIDPKDSITVFVDVTAYNSKNYYVLGEVAVPGRLPVTGRETVLDVINFAGGLTPQADHKAVVLYRQPLKGGPLEALSIDIDQITMGDDMSTNYQVLPGDRLVVPNKGDSGPHARPVKPEQAQRAAARQPGPSLYFARPASSPDKPSDQPVAPVDRAQRTPTTVDIEARLSSVEKKLDVIIEALKTRNP